MINLNTKISHYINILKNKWQTVTWIKEYGNVIIPVVIFSLLFFKANKVNKDLNIDLELQETAYVSVLEIVDALADSLNIILIENILLKELYNKLPLGSPLEKIKVTSKYGWRKNPITKFKEHHDGVDLLAGPWDEVLATGDGIVIRASRYHGLGKCVVIRHEDGYRSLYGHLSKIKIKKGNQVKKGDVIGMAGNTGYTKGYHLHYEVYKNNIRANPMEYINVGENK